MDSILTFIVYRELCASHTRAPFCTASEGARTGSSTGHVLFENLAFVGAGPSDLLKSNITRDESLIHDGRGWNLTHPGVEGVSEFTQVKYCLGANAWGPGLELVQVAVY